MLRSKAARSATQSTGCSPAGAGTRDSKARRSRIEVQRDGSGASSRRISAAQQDAVGAAERLGAEPEIAGLERPDHVDGPRAALPAP